MKVNGKVICETPAQRLQFMQGTTMSDILCIYNLTTTNHKDY